MDDAPMDDAPMDDAAMDDARVNQKCKVYFVNLVQFSLYDLILIFVETR